jgi:probable HAF family extracellular repeat protein
MNFQVHEDFGVSRATKRVAPRLARMGVSTTIVFTCLLTAAPLRAQATFTPLDQFGGVQSQATDISADGSVIVGTSIASPGGTLSVFRVTPQGTTVRSTGFTGSVLRDPSVSADGSTVVGTFLSPRGEEAFRWVGDAPFEGLGDLPGGAFRSDAFGVSGDGSVVVGMSESAPLPAAFRWTAGGGMLSLGGDERSARDVSADGSVVVGSLWMGDVLGPAYRWTAQTGSIELPPIPRPRFSGGEATAVTPDGAVVVGSNSFRFGLTGITDEAFRWTQQEGTVSLQSGGWSFTVPSDVSADGSIVVGRGLDPATTSTGAFLWTSETGMLSLRDVLIFGGAMNLDGWTLVTANGISEDGRTVVGTASGPNGQEAFVATIGAIPEPSTIVLAALAVAGVLGFYFRRSRNVSRYKTMTSDDASIPSRRSFLRNGLAATAAIGLAFLGSKGQGRAAHLSPSPRNKRLLCDKAMQVADVCDFGATGDGKTDDSAGFQAAVDSLVNTPGVVRLPSGTTYFTGNL